MNHHVIQSCIKEYKENFDRIHSLEIYKWKAIKTFQDHWDSEASNFCSMLSKALHGVKNLMDSGSYFPKRMLLNYARTNPEEIRALFVALYNEAHDLIERIDRFQKEIAKINALHFPDRRTYQDARAVIVYLTLRYPDRYFFYKFRMFQAFAQKVNLDYRPAVGKIENLGQFQNVCELIRFQIQEDQELVKLHQSRLDEHCYPDTQLHVLTQDLVYALVKHLSLPKTQTNSLAYKSTVEEADASELIVKPETVDFTPAIINHTQNGLKNKYIGDLGERWVLKQEIAFLTKNGRPDLAKKVTHVAKEKGDGLGYDILSYSLNDEEKFIEVKTTEGGLNSTFYVTRNELEKSKIASTKFYLYRVYNYAQINHTADLLKIQGDLTPICQTPLSYKITLDT